MASRPQEGELNGQASEPQAKELNVDNLKVVASEPIGEGAVIVVGNVDNDGIDNGFSFC